jgi:hypothetical protein
MFISSTGFQPVHIKRRILIKTGMLFKYFPNKKPFQENPPSVFFNWVRENLSWIFLLVFDFYEAKQAVAATQSLWKKKFQIPQHTSHLWPHNTGPKINIMESVLFYLFMNR